MMAPKDRADQVEQRSPLRLPNKISDASPVMTSNLKIHVREEVQKYRHGDVLSRFFLHMSTLTSLLPPHWEKYPVDFKLFIEKELFDPVLSHVLETEELLNWCPSVKKVHPLITPGDGNCLLHAVSLALWGIEDDNLEMRTALYRLLQEDKTKDNYMRWQRERMRADAGIPGSGLVYDSIEWHSEWEIVMDIASPERRPVTAEGLPFESLEQYHIFMLSNMLRRPIIVVAQNMMRSQWGHSLQPQRLDGIYLPLNWDPKVCYRYPILLGFHQNHFTPLLCTATMVPEEDENEYLFPIVHQDMRPMPVHFLTEDEEDQVQDLLGRYLIVEEINHMGKSLSHTHGLPGVRLVSKNVNPDFDLMIPYLHLAETHYRSYLEKEFGSTAQALEPTGLQGIGYDQRLEQPKSLPSISQPIVHQQSKNTWSGSGAPLSQPSEQQGSGPVALQRALSLVQQTCKTEGCIYYRSVTTGEYCHECFEKKLQSHKCQGNGCLNAAENGCQGLCRVCYDQMKLIEGSKASAPPMSKMSLNPVSTYPAGQDGNSNMGHGTADATNNPRDSIFPSLSPDDELNSLVVHQKMATKKCIIPECPLTGEPKMNDMCSKCYNESLEMEKELIAKQLSKHKPSTTSSSAGSSAEAASGQHAPEPLYMERPGTSKYTVQKNICASAGCDGVRLVDSGYHGFCYTCFTKNTKKSSQEDPAVYGAAGSSSENQIYANLSHNYGKRKDGFRVASPTAGVGNPKIVAKSHAVRSDVSKITASQKSVSQNPFADQEAAKGKQAKTTGSQSNQAAHPSDPVAIKINKCMHPRCDHQAAPPKYLLCEQCIFISSMYQQIDKNTEPGSTSQQSEPVEPSKPEEVSKQTVQPATGHLENPKPLPSKTSSKFKNTKIPRVKCQVKGGCADDMFGDPEYNNVCSRCFSKTMMKRTRTRASPPTCLAETQTLQTPSYSNTAPLNPSPRVPPPPPRAHTGYIGERAGIASPKKNPLPTNFQKCAYPGCLKQANLQILEGYCNDCHQVYRDQTRIYEVPMDNPGNPIGNRGRFAFSSQSTVPECWTNAGAPGFGVGADREQSSPVDEMGINRIPPQAEPNRTDMRCKSNGCSNFGNPKCQGYCNSCFRLIKQ